MAIRNNLKGGTDWVKEHPTYQDMNDTQDSFYRKVYADNTGGSHNGDTTETDLATITITQDDLGDDFSANINAVMRTASNNTDSITGTFKLYVNGSAVKTINTQSGNLGGGDPWLIGCGFAYLASSLDSTAGNIIIKVTGTCSTATSANCTVYCDGLTVDAINNNS